MITAAEQAHKACRMAGRGLDLTTPADGFKWEQMAEALIQHWEAENWHYDMMIQMEPDLIEFARDELVVFAHGVVFEN